MESVRHCVQIFSGIAHLQSLLMHSHQLSSLFGLGLIFRVQNTRRLKNKPGWLSMTHAPNQLLNPVKLC